MTLNEYVILHLTAHDLPLGELVAKSKTTRATVERHLKTLRRQGLIVQRPGSGHYEPTPAGKRADQDFRAENPSLFLHSTQ